MTGEAVSGSEDDTPMEWSLWREDSNGNQYKMPLELDGQEEALATQEAYAAKGHHQTYSVRYVQVGDTVTFIPASDL